MSIDVVYTDLQGHWLRIRCQTTDPLWLTEITFSITIVDLLFSILEIWRRIHNERIQKLS